MREKVSDFRPHNPNGEFWMSFDDVVRVCALSYSPDTMTTTKHTSHSTACWMRPDPLHVICRLHPCTCVRRLCQHFRCAFLCRLLSTVDVPRPLSPPNGRAQDQWYLYTARGEWSISAGTCGGHLSGRNMQWVPVAAVSFCGICSARLHLLTTVTRLSGVSRVSGQGSSEPPVLREDHRAEHEADCVAVTG
jgi:hypothetical protein